ncbi:DNA polymerase III subunit gamma/tau [Phenylobacterium sp. Root77]|uniref:DNA polymerase III subunit gamma/tau n=1 Tax=unclassified Phenylobacterium TaxID=2640670 RepID=UPI0006F8FBC5|nr:MULTISPECIES: DNA polymerase III subunit gamma/tau [unclassified Phenylobacterium]KQW70982.1 DNA polymerase III subunit gamma/tau [Phenylobacterium sp. Root1277]KQW95860.1 DNA polymerase III subunit gamma/tau [Phenylobacterium sp. Root1290]KRC41645.1 DNA polymerase III subunit gamma/tau [Phenylobacterium sp. Root77]
MAEDDEPETLERDPNTSDMFGAPAAPPTAPPAEESAAYTVIARKYRPRTFDDLYGQEAMVRTLRNAFASGRIAHAFMLTGVRGVGKTTTARLLARALNYDTDAIHEPSLDLREEGRHCRAIIEGRHMDVLELDAASRTGVNDMRELLDGVRYAPVEARYKVYIIDEVHMLSTGAFNALLKTLEEPPPHAKFIFATTEIRKVPVTILSRCQRFDLRRVEPDVIVKNLEMISEKEGARVDDEGMLLIARAAEGSMRDAQSMLDQAIVQAEAGQTVTAASIRDMLGLADRAQTISLFEQVMRGQAGPAVETFRGLYNFGAEPGQVMLDLMDHTHGASVAKAIGPQALTLPKEQALRLAAVGASVSAGNLSRIWQMLLKAHDEVRRAPDAAAACDMALIRLAYAADLPGPEEALKRLAAGDQLPGGPAPSGGGGGGGGGAAASMGGGGVTAQARVMAAPQEQADAVPTLNSFADVLALIKSKRDIVLQLDVERFVRPISFRQGAIEYEPVPGGPNNLAQRLVARLKEWTGQPWLIAARGGGGTESRWEQDQREKQETRAEVESDPFVTAVMQAFPGAEIVSIRNIPLPEAPAAEALEDEEDEE